MRKIFFLVILLSQLILNGCGGVVGNIKKYHFCVSKYKLETAIKDVMNEYPELKIPNRAKYSYEDNEFSWSCYIKDDNGGEIFSYSFLGDSTSWNKNKNSSRIALIAMAEYGEILDFEKIYFPTTKWRMINKFEKYFVDRVRRKLGCEDGNG